MKAARGNEIMATESTEEHGKIPFPPGTKSATGSP
jgi:hypothetical protein